MDEKRNKLAEMRALFSEKNQELEMFDSKIIKTKQQIEKDTMIHQKKVNDAQILKKSVIKINNSSFPIANSQDSLATDKYRNESSPLAFEKDDD